MEPRLHRRLFDADHDMFRDAVRRFIAREMAPFNTEWEANGIVERAMFVKAGAAGFLAMAVPEKYGGAGVEDFRYNVVIGEELQRVGMAGAGLGWTLHNDIALPYFLRLATPDQMRRWMPG